MAKSYNQLKNELIAKFKAKKTAKKVNEALDEKEKQKTLAELSSGVTVYDTKTKIVISMIIVLMMILIIKRIQNAGN